MQEKIQTNLKMAKRKNRFFKKNYSIARVDCASFYVLNYLPLLKLWAVVTSLDKIGCCCYGCYCYGYPLRFLCKQHSQHVMRCASDEISPRLPIALPNLYTISKAISVGTKPTAKNIAASPKFIT